MYTVSDLHTLGVLNEERYLVQCFINDLDSNFYHACNLLQNGALYWYSLTLNAIIQEVTEVKLNWQASGSWTSDNGTANAAGKQGRKRTGTSTTNSTTAITVDPGIPTYCYKAASLTIKEVQSLMR